VLPTYFCMPLVLLGFAPSPGSLALAVRLCCTRGFSDSETDVDPNGANFGV